ncbi:hypothetical protein [Candidatus Thiosymbion oneisti]|uniref:hypothetical protein n=1 Tax=Candidatus Thiosymbion oneisti TaxID=589554 RepID=UPI00105F051F|nr:hypothetical protein [Candidatus Thiosymbion oneisti]
MGTNEFHIEEYKSLRGEIFELARETRSLERYALFGTAVVWSWLVTTGTGLPDLSYYIPCILVCAGGMRSYAVLKVVRSTSEYLRKIEAKIEKYDDVEGWETWKHTRRSEPYLVTATVYWVALLVVTVIGGCYLSNVC